MPVKETQISQDNPFDPKNFKIEPSKIDISSDKFQSQEEFELFEKMYNSETKKRLESVNPNYLSSYDYLLKNN